jgi:hypothetical protein
VKALVLKSGTYDLQYTADLHPHASALIYDDSDEAHGYAMLKMPVAAGVMVRRLPAARLNAAVESCE